MDQDFAICCIVDSGDNYGRIVYLSTSSWNDTLSETKRFDQHELIQIKIMKQS